MEYNNKDPLWDDETRRLQLQRAKQRRLEQRKRDTQQAIIFLAVVALVIIGGIAFLFSKAMDNSDEPNNQIESNIDSKADNLDQNKSDKQDSSSAKSESSIIQESEHKIETIDGITYADGILIANKSYNLPEDYDPGLNDEAFQAFNEMISGASKDGISIYLCSGYRSYQDQQFQYNEHVQERGVDEADKVSARPGHSEHQTGLAFDVNCTEYSFADTAEGKWLAEHCSEYGFIIRYPEGKEDITGFSYEPWHVRYLGVDIAKKVTDSGLCLEEYLGITSSYDE